MLSSRAAGVEDDDVAAARGCVPLEASALAVPTFDAAFDTSPSGAFHQIVIVSPASSQRE